MSALYTAIRNRGSLTVRGVHWVDLEAAVKEAKPWDDILRITMRRWNRPAKVEGWERHSSWLGREVFALREKDIVFLRGGEGIVRPWPGQFPETNAVYNDRDEVVGLLTAEYREATYQHEGMLISLRSDKESYENAHLEYVEEEFTDGYECFATIPDLCSCKVCHPA